ncbi:uncharacterized protein EI97DRAFT_133960 [Westerdykella ornata]|uniref:Uncharacterized protein n=1 Tax=Westerdykella ornata TaxID=318751 RepID=A0A6A6JFP6_WESOR|nr:uncharacterized protein EI97DRAFT_133960 [Westerdykella ornata]KAF2274019.1 hypothetical protein EI97DRAFT_133960 [Westerdykella ornata]
MAPLTRFTWRLCFVVLSWVGVVSASPIALESRGTLRQPMIRSRPMFSQPITAPSRMRN